MRVCMWIIVALGTPVLLGLVYQFAAAAIDRRRMTRRGRFVEVEGRAVFVAEMGNTGPTVVFESGLVVGSLSWLDIQRTVSRRARTLSYDRLGLGWSDGCRGERVPSVLARELYLVLKNAGAPAPYLLVAHSYGAMIVRAFAAEHPELVAGVVMVDPIRTEAWVTGNTSGQHIMRGGKNLMRRAAVPTWLGVTRLGLRSLQHPAPFTTWLLRQLQGANGKRSADRMTRELCKMPVEVQPEIVAQWAVPGFFAGSAAYIRGIPNCLSEMAAIAPITGVPAIVLRAECSPETSPEHRHCAGAEVREQVVLGSGHWVHLDKPEIVVSAIRELLDGRRTASDLHEAAVDTTERVVAASSRGL